MRGQLQLWIVLQTAGALQTWASHPRWRVRVRSRPRGRPAQGSSSKIRTRAMRRLSGRSWASMSDAFRTTPQALRPLPLLPLPAKGMPSRPCPQGPRGIRWLRPCCSPRAVGVAQELQPPESTSRPPPPQRAWSRPSAAPLATRSAASAAATLPLQGPPLMRRPSRIRACSNSSSLRLRARGRGRGPGTSGGGGCR